MVLKLSKVKYIVMHHFNSKEGIDMKFGQMTLSKISPVADYLQLIFVVK